MRPLRRLLKIVVVGTACLFGLLVAAVIAVKLYLGDERLAHLVSRELNGRLAGHFSVREIHWSLPFHFVIDDVVIDDPEGRPAVRVTHLEATLRWRALLAGTLGIDDIAGHGVDVRVLAMQRDPSELGIAEAFSPKEPSAKAETEDAGGPGIALDFHGPLLAAVELTYDDGETRIVVSGAHLEDVRFGMNGDVLDMDGNMAVARLELALPGFACDDGPLAVRVAHFTIGTGDELTLGAQDAKVTAGGLTLTAAGNLQLPEHGALMRGDLRVGLKAPLEHPLLRGLLRDIWSEERQLRGSVVVGARLDGSRLEIDRMTTEVEGGSLAVTGELTLEAPFAHDLELTLENFPLAELAAQAALPRRLSGQVGAHGTGLAELASRLEVKLQAYGFPAALALAPDPLRVELEAELTPAHADVLHLTAEGDGARLDASGRVPFDAGGIIDVTLKLVHERPRATLARSGTTALQVEALTLDAKARGTPAQLAAQAMLTARGVTAGLVGPADVTLPVHFSRGAFSIEGGTIAVAGSAAILDGTLGVLDEGGHSLGDMPVEAKLLAGNLDLAKLTHGRARGGLLLDASVTGTLQALRGAARVEVTGLATQGVTFTKARAVVAVTPERVELQELALMPERGGGLDGRARYSIRSRQIDAELSVRALPLVAITALTGTDLSPRGDLEAHVALNGGPSRATVRAQATIANAGTLAVDGVIEPEARRVDAKVTLRDAGIAEALALAGVDLPLDGEVALTADVRGAMPYPAVTADLRVTGLLIDGVAPATDSITVAVSTDEADSRYDAHLEFGKTLTATARAWPGRVPAAEIEAAFDALRVSAFSPNLAKAGYDLVLSGRTQVRYAAPRSLEGGLTLTKLTANAGAQAVQLASPVTIAFDGTRIEVPPLTLGGAGSSITLAGSLRAGALAATAEGDLDLSVLGPFVTAVSEPSGMIHITARAAGPPNAPRITGELRIAEEVRARPRGIPQELVISAGRITFGGDALIINELRGRLDTGDIAVHGRIGLAGLRPDSYDVHVRGTKLGIQTRELRLEADTDLHLTGHGLVPDVKGDIVVVTGRYLKKFALKDFNFVGREPDTSAPLSQTAPILGDMDLDILATNAEDITVAVDAGAFAISLPLQLDLRVRGTPLSPAVSGKVSAMAGSIKFPEATLAVQETLVTFTPGLPPAEGAAISLVAEGEVPAKGEDATADEVYLVSMTLSGTLATMQLDLSASPGLDRNQTLALLITGKAGFDQLFYGSGSTTGTASGRSTSPEVDAAVALAGAGVTGPLTGFVENQLEDRLNLKVDLSASFTTDQVRVTARKELTPRLRLEGSVQRALQTTGNNLNVAAATFVLGNRWFLQVLAQTAQGNAVTDTSIVRPRNDNRIEMRYRLIGD